MKKLRWQLIIILLTGLVVGVLLITQQPSSTPTLTPQPTKGGVYTEGLIGSFKRLNPILDIHNGSDRDVDRLLFSGLVRFDSTGAAQPDLAESWGVSQDGTTYNVALRANATWHDGKPVTSDDVVFTMDLLRSDNAFIPSDVQKFWKDVKVKRLDEKNLQFVLPEAYAPFLDYLTIGILPKHLLGDLPMDKLVDAPFNLQPVGTGPYRLDHLVVENGQVQGIVLTVFDKYYGKAPNLQQIVFRYYPDSQAALDAYDASEIQGVSQVTADVLPRALAEPNLKVYTGRQPMLTMVLFNTNSDDAPFFKEAAVRRALMAGLNRQWMIDQVLQGQAILADGPLFPGTWAYNDKLEKIAYDPATAAKGLKDAGYALPTEGDQVLTKDGKALAFKLVYPDTPQFQSIAEAIQKNWTALNVKVDLESLPYDQLMSDRLDPRQYQAALVDLNLSRSPDPDPYPFWDQAQVAEGQNYTQWNEKTASEYLEQARITTDTAERARLYRNFQVIFVKEMPALPLFYPVYSYAVDKQIQGVQMGPLLEPSDRFATIQDWFLNSKRTANSSSNTP